MVGLRCMELDALLAAGAQQRALRANMGRATRRPVAAARARRRGRAAHRAHSGDGRCRCGRAGGGGRRAAPPSLAPSPPITFIFVTDRTCVSRLFVVTDDVWRHTSCDPLPCTRLRSVRAMGLCVWQRRQFFDRECRRDTEVMRYLILHTTQTGHCRRWRHALQKRNAALRYADAADAAKCRHRENLVAPEPDPPPPATTSLCNVRRMVKKNVWRRSS